MQTIKNEIKNILSSQGVDNIAFNIPPQKEIGDLSSAVAIGYARKIGKKPIETAEDLKKLLDGKLKFIKKIAVSEPGYLNFFIDYENFGKEIILPAISNNTLISKKGSPEKISIEHTGVNPNKAMHIGHLRNSIIGDIMVRMHKVLGYETQALNYIDNTGTQVADTVTAILYLDEPYYEGEEDFKDIWGKWDKSVASFDYYCWDIYARFSQAIESGNADLIEKRKEIFKKIEGGNNPIAKFAKKLAAKIVNDHIETCKKLGIGFDLLIWESDIIAKGLWEKTFLLLRNKEILVKETERVNAGCWVIRAGGIEKSGDEEFSKDKILVKSDGTLTYTAKDLAYQLWKLGKLGIDFDYAKWGNDNIFTTSTSDIPSVIPATCLACLDEPRRNEPRRKAGIHFGGYDKIINVIDTRQSYPQEIIKEVIKRMGYLDKDENYHHLSYGVVNLTDKAAKKIGVEANGKAVSMSGRKGIGVKADDLINITIDEISKRAKDATISQSLASTAIRFYMAKYSSNQIINFDFEEALQTTGESGIYLSYSYARAINVLLKSDYKQKEFIIPATSESEQNLINKISEFDEVIDQAINSLEPAIIARYTFELCSVFSDFYENTEPIYKTEGDLQQYRLSLVKVFTIVLKDLFSILGIEPLEKI